MRCFYYQRLLPTGQLKTGLEKLAFSRRESAQFYLEQRGDDVIVRLWMFPQWFNTLYDTLRRIGRKPLTQDEMADFFHNLAVMQRSGVPMFDAIHELSDDSNRPQVRRLAENVLESLRSGATLSTSLERHSDNIPQTVLYLVAIGESSGTLDRTLMDAAEHLRRVGKITQDAKRAMIYPVFVFAAIIAAAMFWIVYVIPNLSELFLQMGVEMPVLTQGLLAFAERVSAWFGWLLFGSIILVYTCHLLIKGNQKVRYGVHRLLLRLPVSSVLMRSSSMAFITEYLSLLVGAGINLLDSLKVLERSTGNEVYRTALMQVRKGMKRGSSLSEEMRLTGEFPGFVIRMISVGEQTGSLETQLRYLADDYRRRFDHVVSSISEIVKPVVMIFAGLLFIIMIVALFLPIYDLIRHMSDIGG